MSFHLRAFEPADGPALLTLFLKTIRQINAKDYGDEQIAAWASPDIEVDAWTKRFDGRFVVVAEDPAVGLVGFAELEADGHIDRVYVAADYQARGVGRQMMSAILEEAKRQGIPRVYLEASITARPFFEQQGFEVLAPQTVEIRGARLVNYRMQRQLR